jgi:hypothetical protein
MNRKDILDALRELGMELERGGMHGEVLVVGGAARCLAHDARDATKDVDAIFEPKTEVREAIAKVAIRLGLSDDWLNDGVKGFIFTKPESEPFMELPGLSVSMVTPEYLLAMKLYSARTQVNEMDSRDITTLLGILNIDHSRQAFDVLEKFYPADKILPKTQYLLEELIGNLAMEKKGHEKRSHRSP